MTLFSTLFPYVHADSVYGMDFEHIYEIGFRGLEFDIDNTLVGHDAPANEQAAGLFQKLKKIGFELCIISNNNEARVKPFADAVGSRYVYKAGKPYTKGYLEGCRLMGLDKDRVLFFGDQFFTDIWGANRSGIKSVLVKRMYFHERWTIHLKRILEKVIFVFYRFSGSYNRKL